MSVNQHLNAPKNIIISRTDSIGDVVLTLPLAKIIKNKFPEVKIWFLGQAYTKPVIECCTCIDYFIDVKTVIKDNSILAKIEADVIIHVYPNRQVSSIAKLIGIPVRIGTSHRWYHWLNCNFRVNFSRRDSPLHEADLNQFLLHPMGIDSMVGKEDIPNYYQFEKIKPLSGPLKHILERQEFKIILHPKSKGSAREWPLSHYDKLIKSLPRAKYFFFICGTKEEGERIEAEYPSILNNHNVVNLCGKMNLDEYIAFIQISDLLIACSTGPLHISAALGTQTIGLYPPKRNINIGRWGALGTHAKCYSQGSIDCSKCDRITNCQCLQDIFPSFISDKVQSLKA